MWGPVRSGGSCGQREELQMNRPLLANANASVGLMLMVSSLGDGAVWGGGPINVGGSPGLQSAVPLPNMSSAVSS